MRAEKYAIDPATMLFYGLYQAVIDVDGCFHCHDATAYGGLVCYDHDLVGTCAGLSQGVQRLGIEFNLCPFEHIRGAVLNDHPIAVEEDCRLHRTNYT